MAFFKSGYAGKCRRLRGLHRLDPRRQAGQFARRRVLVQDALAYATVNFGLHSLQGGLCGFRVAGLDGIHDFLDECACVGNALAIDGGTAHGAANAFFG